MVRRRRYIKKDEDYLKEKGVSQPMPTTRKIMWGVFVLLLLPFLFYTPTILSTIGPYINDHMNVLYITWGVYAVILFIVKMFKPKHNWDSFSSLVIVGMIVGMVIYQFFGFQKHFPNEIKRLGFYLWLTACMIPTILFIIVDDTDYLKILEKEQMQEEEERKLAERVHMKYVKRREENPPFWMKTKTRKVICDTIVYICFILIIVLAAYLLYDQYNKFQYRVRNGIDVNDYAAYDEEGYGEEFDAKKFIHDEDLE